MTAALETLPSPLAVALPPLPAGWQALSHAALADGSLAILGTDVDLRAERRRSPDGAPSPGNPFRLARRASGRIWTCDGDALREGPVFPLASPYLLVDRFPDGRWLVARSVADIDSGERIFSPHGDILASIYFGDGLAHMKIDDAGRIWVGWYDEGVFGNSSWTMPGRQWPPSRSGIACFDEHGAVLHEAEQHMVDDCYALATAGTMAWACTYSGFPIIALGGGPPRRWSTSLAGIRAIAVAGDHVLAAGGYGEDGNRVTLLRLGSDQAEVLHSWRLPFTPARHGQPDAPFLDGRSDKLHLVDRGIWHRWSVEDFLPTWPPEYRLRHHPSC